MQKDMNEIFTEFKQQTTKSQRQSILLKYQTQLKLLFTTTTTKEHSLTGRINSDTILLTIGTTPCKKT